MECFWLDLENIYFCNKELLGYVQSAAGLTFVVIRNAGHMVPIDTPEWALRVVEDFLHKTK